MAIPMSSMPVIYDSYDNLGDGIAAMIDAMVADYAAWTYTTVERTKTYHDSISIKIGSKYIKIITGTSVHSFIVRTDDGLFSKGAILKAASWRAPATNFSRGNVLSGNFSGVRWTGVQ